MGEPKLRQTLRGFQIFFIVISAIIGGGVFSNNGEALEVAGPAGLILSVVVIGFIAIFVSEGISELSQQFPAPNAIVEYVKTFVDEDLGWVVGIAYWYAFASVFAVQNLAAAQLSTYWGLSQTWQTLGFYVLAPICVVVLNFFGVFWYGLVETVGGALKVLFLFGVSILLYVFAAQAHDGGPNGPINDGFKNDAAVAPTHSQAVCYAIPLVAYSFLGVEIITVTAFEAKYSSSLKIPSRIIAYAVFFLYLLCTIGETLTVSYMDSHLPLIYGGGKNSNATSTTNPNSTSIIVNAAWEAHHKKLAGFLNGCLIFSVLSASNTSLYVSSRTLYGLTRDIPDTNWFGKKLQRLSLVVPQTGVPAAALLVSAVSFFWLPFLQLKAGYAIGDLIEIMSVSASVSCLVVWAALCIAFIRYERWQDICDKDLRASTQYESWRRKSSDYKSYTFLGFAQPYIAYFGLLGCILVFGFASATWWSTPANLTKVAVAYAAHVIFALLFIVFKIFNRRWWVKLDTDVTVLIAALDRLRWLKQDQVPTDHEMFDDSNVEFVQANNNDK